MYPGNSLLFQLDLFLSGGKAVGFITRQDICVSKMIEVQTFSLKSHKLFIFFERDFNAGKEQVQAEI